MSTPEIFVRVHGLRGLHPDVMQKHHRGRVSISAKIGDEVLSTGAVAWGGGIKLNEINYGASNGTLRWSVPSALLQEVKASQPRLKFSVNAHDASGDGPGEKVGYIVLDIRDLSLRSLHSAQRAAVASPEDLPPQAEVATRPRRSTRVRGAC